MRTANRGQPAPPRARVTVKADRTAYDVVIGPDLIAELPTLLAPNGATRATIVSCGPVWRRHGRRLKLFAARPPLIIPDGERAKTLATAGRLYDEFARRALDRAGLVIAFGGGVVGDVAGFAAATYLRGVRVIQVPTTLLAQVDSAIGGKTGVNLRAGKNLVGAFHAPTLVVCDPVVLRTLPVREFQSGLYEVLKYGIIASAPLFDRVTSRLDALRRHDVVELTEIIAECCRIKARVVTEDERESGLRRILNFGHTVGHALEAVTRYRRFRHGEAIGHGMRAAVWLSNRRGYVSSSDAARIYDAIDRLGRRPPVRDLKIAETLAAISHDKKQIAGRLHFVLAEGIGGHRIVSDLATAELEDALRFLGLRR